MTKYRVIHADFLFGKVRRAEQPGQRTRFGTRLWAGRSVFASRRVQETSLFKTAHIVSAANATSCLEFIEGSNPQVKRSRRESDHDLPL
jgi:hypothetical protein